MSNTDLKHRIGYPCINTKLRKEGIYTNRKMIKKTFLLQKDTLEGVSILALKNVQDLIKIVQWNDRHNIKFFRMSSSMFPWMSEYELTDLPNWNLIEKNLKLVGDLSIKYGQRITNHPGPFNVLASHNPFVVSKTIKELDQHAQIFDAMGYTPSYWNKINIHINTTNGGKVLVTERFCEAFQKLKPSTKARLVIENDDKPSQYSVKDIYELVHKKIGIPITFDVHHHKYCSGNLTHKEAAILAASTWPDNIPPCFHFASTIKHEIPEKMARAHADWIYEEIDDYGTGAWIMCECKAKENAIQLYLSEGIKYSEYNEEYCLINE